MKEESTIDRRRHDILAATCSGTGPRTHFLGCKQPSSPPHRGLRTPARGSGGRWEPKSKWTGLLMVCVGLCVISGALAWVPAGESRLVLLGAAGVCLIAGARNL